MNLRIAASICAALLATAACEPKEVEVIDHPGPGGAASLNLAGGSSTYIQACGTPTVRALSLTAPDAKDMLTGMAVGQDCEQAALLLTLNTADGTLLWSKSALASDTGAFIPDDENKPVDAPKALEARIKSMVDTADIGTSLDAPDWPEGAERPVQESGLFVTTPLPRETYLEQRAKGWPTLCVAYVMGRVGCAIRDPESGYVTDFYDLSS